MSRNLNDAVTDPAKLVRLELKNAGFDIDRMNVPKRVFLLADSLYDAMLLRDCGKYKYPLGGKLFVFNNNEETGYIKSHMCSPAIAGSITSCLPFIINIFPSCVLSPVNFYVNIIN